MFDTGWLVTFSFFFILVEKNLLRNFLSVAKMASRVFLRRRQVTAADKYSDLAGFAALLIFKGHR